MAILNNKLSFSFRNVLRQNQDIVDNARWDNQKPEGAKICIECRRDTPEEELTEERSDLGVRGQLCKTCHNARERRLKQHTRRIQANLRRVG